MHVVVRKLNKTNNGSVVTVCSTENGDITGIWQGEAPNINQSCFVELDVPQKLVWGVDILTTDSHEYRAWIEGNTTFAIAKKEVYDEFKSLMFRIGDHFMQVETEGVPILNEPFIRIKLINLLIYPIEY